VNVPEKVFQAVIDRLRDAAKLPTETAVAEALGFQQATFAMRKWRLSLPADEIKVYCVEQGINPDWVLFGFGEVYTSTAEQQERRALTAKVVEAISPMNLPDAIGEGMKTLLIHAISGNSEATIRTWNSIGSVVDQKEKDLLTAYRNSREELRDIFESLVTLSTVQRELGVSGLPSRMRGPKLAQTFRGNVGQVIHGDQKIDGPLSFDLSSKPKSKKSNKPAAK
jgi:hypothetical protein